MQAPPKRWKKRQQLKPDVISELQVALADLKLTPLLLQLLANREVINPQALHAEPEDDQENQRVFEEIVVESGKELAPEQRREPVGNQELAKHGVLRS